MARHARRPPARDDNATVACELRRALQEAELRIAELLASQASLGRRYRRVCRGNRALREQLGYASCDESDDGELPEGASSSEEEGEEEEEEEEEGDAMQTDAAVEPAATDLGVGLTVEPASAAAVPKPCSPHTPRARLPTRRSCDSPHRRSSGSRQRAAGT